MEKEKSKVDYTCYTPFALEGRPVFGGQIFSHIIKCAIEETRRYEIITGDCIFMEKTNKDLPVIYKSTVLKMGKTIKLVTVEVIQKENTGKKVRAVGTVLLQKPKHVILGDKKKFIIIATHIQKNDLSEYFDKETSDEEKINQMQTPKKFWESILKKEEYFKYTNILHKIYNRRKVWILANKNSVFSRCIGYQFSKTSTSTINREENQLDEIYMYLSYLSDEHLLETVLISKRVSIINEEYNILTISHSMKFNDCTNFDLFQPFFYSINIENIYNNIVSCSGMFVQKEVVYANTSQIGKIILHPSAK